MSCLHLHTMHVFHVLCLLPALNTQYRDFIKCLSIWVTCCCLFCLCSDAGAVLADRLFSLHSLEKLCIRDINPTPVLRVLSENAEHCAVSTLGIAFGYQPKLVRSVSGSMHHLLSKQTMHLILTLVNVFVSNSNSAEWELVSKRRQRTPLQQCTQIMLIISYLLHREISPKMIPIKLGKCLWTWYAVYR